MTTDRQITGTLEGEAHKLAEHSPHTVFLTLGLLYAVDVKDVLFEIVPSCPGLIFTLAETVMAPVEF